MKSVLASVAALLGCASTVLAFVPKRIGLGEYSDAGMTLAARDTYNSSYFQQIIDHKVIVVLLLQGTLANARS
jgi:hypothetical protein